MSARRKITSAITRALTSRRRRKLTARFAEMRRKARGDAHRVEYFHQVDDPYSHLAVQTLARLVEAYDIELRPHLVGPPPDDAAAEREMLQDFGRRDAHDIASGYGMEFTDPGAQPPARMTRLAQRILANALEPAKFVELAPRVGEALWRGDQEELERLAALQEPAAESIAESRIAKGSERRRKLGHYLGGMFFYAGEWYWGVDRLHHLERRLTDLGAARGKVLLYPRPQAPKSDRRDEGSLTLEYFPSLRSPYTAISMRATYEMADRCGVRLVLRPVMPMVMRGVPAPLRKGLYIMMDTKREADDQGVPFGKLVDPIGEPVLRGFSLFPWARDKGKGREYLQAFIDAAWTQGIDTGSDEGMRRVVEGAGLSWSEAAPIIDNEDWTEELEQNRLAMYEAGLWGVPSFRLSSADGGEPFSTWGQDRLWVVEREICSRIQAGGSK